MRRTLMAGAALLALAGCGDGASEGGSGAGAENSAGSSYTSPDGRSEVRSGDAALSGLPEGIPPYPRANPSGAIQFGGASEEGEMRAMGFTHRRSAGRRHRLLRRGRRAGRLSRRPADRFRAEPCSRLRARQWRRHERHRDREAWRHQRADHGGQPARAPLTGCGPAYRAGRCVVPATMAGKTIADIAAPDGACPGGASMSRFRSEVLDWFDAGRVVPGPGAGGAARGGRDARRPRSGAPSSGS